MRFTRYGISIPTGAIKRMSGGGGDRFGVGFQFLLVRLKVDKVIVKDGKVCYFNSYWCD